MSAIMVYGGRVFAGTGEEALERIAALHPLAVKIRATPVMRLQRGIWWEYYAVFEEAAA